MPVALRELKSKLLQWNLDVYGNINTRKVRAMSEVQKTQRLLSHAITTDLLAVEECQKKELELVLDQEEILWYQKSREQWICLGDRTYRTFIPRPQFIRVIGVSELEAMAVTFFRLLYALASLDDISVFLPKSGFAFLTNPKLSAPFSSDDIERTVRALAPFKSSGPDDFQPIFYHRC
ncbi:hypothetical protein V2J09_022004 [Rumex salicifolius]